MTRPSLTIVITAAIVAVVAGGSPSYAADHPHHGGSGGTTSPTTLTAEGAGRITFSDWCYPIACPYPSGVNLTLRATLTYADPSAGTTAPVPGATIVFQLAGSATGEDATGPLCTAMTLQGGDAICYLSPGQIESTAGDYFIATYAGEPNVYAPSSSSRQFVFAPHTQCGGGTGLIPNCS